MRSKDWRDLLPSTTSWLRDLDFPAADRQAEQLSATAQQSGAPGICAVKPYCAVDAATTRSFGLSYIYIKAAILSQYARDAISRSLDIQEWLFASMPTQHVTLLTFRTTLTSSGPWHAGESGFITNSPQWKKEGILCHMKDAREWDPKGRAQADASSESSDERNDSY